jgi:hypothetical protein
MELAGSLTLSLGKGFALFTYFAAAGEPALGPVAHRRRISSISDPLAPIGHRWQDSTQVSSGVLTAGAFSKHLKLEGSWFNGREPDENRRDLDLRIPDSYSGRVTVNPTAHFSVQGSYGYLHSPDRRQPEVPLHRVTASATYNWSLTQDRFRWASTFIYGHNIPAHGPPTYSFLMEHNVTIARRHVVFSRAEYGTRTGGDLVLGSGNPNERFHLALFTSGYVHYFDPIDGIEFGMGGRGSLGVVGNALKKSYGTHVPVGGTFFIQLRPGRMAVPDEHQRRWGEPEGPETE